MSSGKDQGTDGGDKVRLVTHMLQDIDKATCAAARRTLLWSTKEQAGAPARRQHLLNVLDSLGAQDQAPWSAQCAVHRQAQQVDSRGLSLPVEGAKELLIVTQQDTPLECCLVLRSEKQLLHGDSELPLVLGKTGLYKRRLLLVYEGYMLLWGDFVVRVGEAAVRPTNAVLGTWLQLEYLPLDDVETAKHVLKEATQILSEAAATQSGGLQEVQEELSSKLPCDTPFQHSSSQLVATASILLANMR